MLNQIVGRCRVSDSNLAVIRYVISRLKRKYKTYQTMDKVARRTMLQQIIDIHAAHRRTYSYVMGSI